MDIWVILWLVFVGSCILMLVYEFVKWLFKGKTELSTLAQLIISELNYPPETLSFKDGYYNAASYYNDPNLCDKDEISTPHHVMVKRAGFWGYIKCFYLGKDVTGELTTREAATINKVYTIAVKNKRIYLEKVKTKQYEDALIASQALNSSCTK